MAILDPGTHQELDWDAAGRDQGANVIAREECILIDSALSLCRLGGMSIITAYALGCMAGIYDSILRRLLCVLAQQVL